MDNSSLQNLLKRLCKVIWEANVTDPLTYVTQLAYLLFLKMLEEMDAAESGPARPSLFQQVKIGGEEVNFGRLRWSILTSDPDNERMLDTLRDVLPRLAMHPALSPGAKAIFDDARIVIPDGATLRRLVDLISPINLTNEDADVKGDLFETLSSDLGQQKRSAQFRTPRHLIRVIVEMVNPTIGSTVCDSACGTGGFLIAAYEHILLANTSPEFIREVIVPGGLTVKRGIGDRLTPSQWDFLQKGTLHGFDGEQTFVRMTAMNALLHGFDHSPIVRRDSIGGSEDKWDEVQFDFILENPPFSGAAQSPKRSLRVEKGDKYVLFLAAALRSLRPGGRAGIVLPNGILFGDTNAHIEVKKRMLAEFDLQAVVMLPKGMFEPYTPIPSCVLVVQKTGRPTEDVWFYRVEGDGSSLSKTRKFGPQFRNDFPDLLKRWPKRATGENVAWRVRTKRIIESGYNLTLSSLGLVESDETNHVKPEDILASIETKQRRILAMVEQMRELLTEHGLRTVLTSDKAAIRTQMRNLVRLRVPDVVVCPDEAYQFAGVYSFGRGVFKSALKSGRDFAYSRLTRLKSGDFVYPKLMAWEGALGMVPPECDGCMVSPEFPVFEVDSSQVFPEVLDVYFRRPSVWSELALKSVGTNARRRRLNPQAFLDYEMALPSRETQILLRRIWTNVDGIKRVQSETDAELAAFTPALLAKAFRGEL